MTKTRASACHGNVKQAFSLQPCMFNPLQSWKQTGLAFSEATLRGPVNPLITFSLPMILTFPSYAVETFPPNEIRDLINHSVSFLSVLSPSPLDMSRHVKNDQPGHSGQGECGSVTPKVMVTLLIAALAPFKASCGRSTKKGSRWHLICPFSFLGREQFV